MVLLDIINSDKRQSDITFLENYPQNSYIYSAPAEHTSKLLRMISTIFS